MTPVERLQAWHDRMMGTVVRGQTVECVSLMIDSDPIPDLSCRVFLLAHFRENPAPGPSKEERLLQRVFSEVPRHAQAGPLTWDEAVRIMRGEQEPYWVLEDEVVAVEDRKNPLDPPPAPGVA